MDENGFNNMGADGGQPQGGNTPPSQPQPEIQNPVSQFAQQQPAPPVYDDSYNYEQSPAPKKKREKKKGHGIGGIITAVAVAGILVGCLLMAFVIGPIINGGNSILPTLPNQKTEQQPKKSDAEQAPQLGGESADIKDSANPVVDIAEAMKDSVVGITTYTRQLVSGQEPVEQAIGAGTGFVISSEGYILTNNHVVEGGNVVRVKTSDNEEYVAEIVGQDAASDVAVLKIDGLNLTAAPIGNSDELKVGELSVVIGNVHGDTFNNTVTVGYVSNVNTTISVNGITLDVIQTDAAVNPGDSGGPLLDSKGNVIGMTTAKQYYSGFDGSGNALSSEGIGYAIPINKAIDIAQQLIENGSIPRPGIGLSYAMISEVDASLWKTPQGALVADVTPGGPAEKAGIKQNDVITEIDGVDLTTADKMPSFDGKNIGDTISATVWRDGKEYSVSMTLEDLNGMGASSPEQTPQGGDNNQLFPELP